MLEAEAVDWLVKRYPSMDDEKPSGWAFLDAKGEVIGGSPTLTICHAQMKYGDRKSKKALLNSIPYKEGDGTGFEFVRALIKGPFKKWAHLIEMVKYKDTEYYYLKITGLDKFPANVLYNFCIACRYPFENGKLHKGGNTNYDKVKHIDKMIAAGVPLLLAYIIGACDWKDNQAPDPWDWTLSSTVYYGYNSNHHWFDNTSDWGRILSGDLVSLSGSFYDDGLCMPANCIWGHHDNRVFSGLSVRDFYNKYKDLCNEVCFS